MVDQPLFSSFQRPALPADAPAQRAAPVQCDGSPPADPPAPRERDTGPGGGEPSLGGGKAADTAAAADPDAGQRPIAASPFPLDLDRVSAVGLACDQLGLIHPDVIEISARLPGSPPVVLDATRSGLYRPEGQRPAAWADDPFPIGLVLSDIGQPGTAA